MLHEEADGIAAFTATKAFIDFFGRRDGKRRCFLVVKRANAQVIGTPFFELYKFSDDINNIYPAGNLLYGLGRNHNLSARITNSTGFQQLMLLSERALFCGRVDVKG
jgi:hypothetical protein